MVFLTRLLAVNQQLSQIYNFLSVCVCISKCYRCYLLSLQLIGTYMILHMCINQTDRGIHMLAGSLTEESHPRSSHIARLVGHINIQLDKPRYNCSTSMNRDMVLVTSEGRFFKTKGIFGKMSMLDRASLSVKKKFSR